MTPNNLSRQTNFQSEFPACRVEIVPGGVPHSSIRDAQHRRLLWFGTAPNAELPTPSTFIDRIRHGEFVAFPSPWAAIVEGTSDEGTWVVTDQLGLQHIFIRSLTDRILVGPDIFALAKVKSTKIDPIGAHQLMCCGNPQGNRTLFTGISRIPPATILHVGPENDELTYWIPPSRTEPIKDWNGTVAHFANAVQNALARAWSDGFQQELTAGVDSFLVLSGLLNAGIDVRTWTHSFADGADLQGARQRAAFYGVPHRVIYSNDLLGYNTESLFADFIKFMRASNAMADALAYLHLPFVLERLGDGGSLGGVGGEIFRGFYYNWAGRGVLPKAIGRRVLLHGKIRRDMPHNQGLWPKKTCDRSLCEIEAELDRALSQAESYWAGLDVYYIRSRMHHFAGTTYSATGQWGKVRVPLVDPEILDLLATVPVEWRKNSSLVRAATHFLLGKRGVPPNPEMTNARWSAKIEKLVAFGKRNLARKNRDLVEFKVPFAQTLLSLLQPLTNNSAGGLLTAGLYNPSGLSWFHNQLSSGRPLPTSVGAFLTIEFAARELGEHFDGISNM